MFLTKRKIPFFLWLITICLFASGFFAFLFRYDNKYTIRAQVAQDSVTYLSSSSDQNVFWLVEGWEFTPDQLLNPGETDPSSVFLYIGQYFIFSQFHADGSPYGSGTYRLMLHGTGTYTFLLPEVFSACRVYANGTLIASSGSLSPYEPDIKDLVFSLTLNGTTELLIQTVNNSHYYSGITYPPAIGSSEAISRLLVTRMLYYGFLAFTSLALALFASTVWWGSKSTRISGENFWMGILALSFFLRLCYPFIHMFGLPFQKLFYLLEDSMAALGIFCIVQPIASLCLRKKSWLAHTLKIVSVVFLLLSFLIRMLLLPQFPQLTVIYGQLLYWYKLTIAIFLIIVLVFSFWNSISEQTPFLLTGLLLYAISLVAHAYCLGSYEPIRFGWFEEWGTYALILCFATRIALRNVKIIQENWHLNHHLQEEVEQKTASLSKLLEERRMLLSAFAHDVKTPLTSITTFTRLVELDNDHLDEESLQYLDIIRRKTKEIQEQLNMLNKFSNTDTSLSTMKPVDLGILLQTFFKRNQSDIQFYNLHFELHLPTDTTVMIRGDEQKLISVLQNLVYNAVSCTPENGWIRLTLSCLGKFALLSVEDSGIGITEEDLPHIFDRFFTLRKNKGGQGIGLFLVKSIVTEHQGTIHVRSTVGKGTNFTIQLPMFFPDSPDTQNEKNRIQSTYI